MHELPIKNSLKRLRFPLGKLLGTFLIAALLAFPVYSLGQKEEVTRMEFIRLMAKEQSTSKMVPKNAAKLSDDELYKQVTQNLKKNGFNVLVSKKPNQPLSRQEFVRLTYAFSGQPAGKSLFDQKQYLKNANIISTADVGLTTGLQGRAVQYRDEIEGYSASELAAPVFMQDRVETDLDSMITFTFDDGSTMSLGEDAVVNITEHIYDPDKDFRKTIVNVALGAVRFKVTKGKAEGSMFQVLTPVATAGVRGTEFVTIVEPGGKTKFVGIEGLVETFSRLPNGKEGKHEMVSAGTMNSISENGASSGVQKADAATINDVIQQTSPDQTLTEQPGITLAKAMQATGANLKTANTLANDVVQSAVTEAAKDAAQIAAKDAAQIATKDAAQIAAIEATKEAAMQAAKDSIKASTKDVIKTTANTFGGIADPGGNPNTMSVTGQSIAEVVGGLSQSSSGVVSGGTGGGIGGGGGISLPGIGGGGIGNGGCLIPPCGNAKGQGKGKGKGIGIGLGP